MILNRNSYDLNLEDTDAQTQLSRRGFVRFDLVVDRL